MTRRAGRRRRQKKRKRRRQRERRAERERIEERLRKRQRDATSLTFVALVAVLPLIFGSYAPTGGLLGAAFFILLRFFVGHLLKRQHDKRLAALNPRAQLPKPTPEPEPEAPAASESPEPEPDPIQLPEASVSPEGAPIAVPSVIQESYATLPSQLKD